MGWKWALGSLVAAVLVACGAGETVGFDAAVTSLDGSAADASAGADRTISLDLGVAEDVPSPDSGELPWDPSCIGCRRTGQSCERSINCPAGDICNQPGEPDHDPAASPDVCIQIVCSDNNDCAPPKTCAPDGRCRAPICQRDADCDPGLACVGGGCTARPTELPARCLIVSEGRVLTQGETAALQAIGVAADGRFLPWVDFGFVSDAPAIVGISGATASGGASYGTATITATAGGGLSCTAVYTNLAPLAAGARRVTVVTEEDEVPVPGATVEIFSNGGGQTLTTDTQGGVSFAGPSEAVLAFISGRSPVAIVSPGADDLLITLPPAEDRTRAGGHRGFVDLRAAGAGDVSVALVGGPVGRSAFDFGSAIGRSLCDPLAMTIDAPELGISNEQRDTPAGMVLGLGTRHLMEVPERCAGISGPADALGCYSSQSDGRRGALWAMGKRLGLAGLASLHAEALLPCFPGLGSGWLALLQESGGMHGLVSVAPIGAAPKVPRATLGVDCTEPELPDYALRCSPDRASFSQQDIALDTTRTIHTIIELPLLPATPGSPPFFSALIVASALVPGGGMVPLGMNFVMDQPDGSYPDGIIDAQPTSFGPGTPPVPARHVPLALAPLHGGLEGSPIVLTAIALEGGAFSELTPFGPRLISKRLDAVGPAERLDAPFLTTATFGPTGYRYLASTRTCSYGVEGTRDGIARLRLRRGNRSLTVYAPEGTSLVLPEFSLLASLSSADTAAEISVTRAGQSFGEHVRRGSTHHWTRLLQEPSLQTWSATIMFLP